MTNCQKYEALLRRLHALIREDKDDSPEGEEIRDEMDGYWNGLSVEEVQAMNQLSSDLYDNPEQI